MALQKVRSMAEQRDVGALRLLSETLLEDKTGWKWSSEVAGCAIECENMVRGRLTK